jgi:hypothetical protein
MSWSKVRIEEVRRRAAAGERARAIAVALGDGVTRDAVLGKCRREGIKLAPVSREEQVAFGRRGGNPTHRRAAK